MRDAVLSQAEADSIWQTWRQGFPLLDEVPLRPHDDVAREAGRVARVHVLRGADAVHVATALVRMRMSPDPDDVFFLTADRRQADAARAEGLEVELIPA